MSRDVNVSGRCAKSTHTFTFTPTQLLTMKLFAPFISLLGSVAVNDAQDDANFGTGVAISAAVIVILLIFILIVFLHR